MGNPSKPFSFSGGSLREDEWEALKQIIELNGFQSVLEIGAGFSTVLLAQTVSCLRSFETSQDWAEKVVEEVGEGIVTPYMYPNFPDLEPETRFDVALVDGPAGCSDRRQASIEFAKRWTDVILIHDYGRDIFASENAFDENWIHMPYKARFGIALKKSVSVVILDRNGDKTQLGPFKLSKTPEAPPLSTDDDDNDDNDDNELDGLDGTLSELAWEHQREKLSIEALELEPEVIPQPKVIPESEVVVGKEPVVNEARGFSDQEVLLGLGKCKSCSCSVMEFPEEYVFDQYGFIKQVQSDEFQYSMAYKEDQSTNLEMSFLRIGWLSAHFGYQDLKSFKVVDVGCGNGMFVACGKKVFKRIYCYDVVGPSISEEMLYNEEWDLVVLSDVLEHYKDIDRLFDMHWRYAMVSFPETPDVSTFGELRKWRHFKPNEHLYYLTMEGVTKWVEGKGDNVRVISTSHFEDLIRTRWDENKPNISTVLIERKSS